MSINQLKKRREITIRKDEQLYSHWNYASICSQTVNIDIKRTQTKKTKLSESIPFVTFNRWNVPWNLIAFFQNSFVISPGLLYYLIRRDVGRLANEAFSSNPIFTSKRWLSDLKIANCIQSNHKIQFAYGRWVNEWFLSHFPAYEIFWSFYI